MNALQSVDLLVLDEADRLLDPSFVYKALTAPSCRIASLQLSAGGLSHPVPSNSKVRHFVMS